MLSENKVGWIKVIEFVIVLGKKEICLYGYRFLEGCIKFKNSVCFWEGDLCGWGKRWDGSFVFLYYLSCMYCLFKIIVKIKIKKDNVNLRNLFKRKGLVNFIVW